MKKMASRFHLSTSFQFDFVSGFGEINCIEKTLTRKKGVEKIRTFNEWRQAWVSASSIETMFSEAAARYLPRRGWNLTWVVPP